MKRIIKFRVWCKVSNKYHYDWQNIITGHLNYKSEKYPNGIDAINDDLLEFQQFTGLLDKNGIEIYEGDIVNKISPTFKNKTKVVIEFRQGTFGFSFGSNDLPYQLLCPEKEIEVIGNIFQNPEWIPEKESI